MPQEFHVLRCYSCSLFQVHIVKKVNKWQCKVCNEKQSVKKVYGQGNSKDCRNHVQRLNSLQITAEQTNVQVQQASALSSQNCTHQSGCSEVDTEESYGNKSREPSSTDSTADSKWSRYIQPKSKEVSSEDESEVLVPRFAQKHKTRRGRNPRQRGQRDDQFQPSSSNWSQLKKQDSQPQPQQDYIMTSKWGSYGEKQPESDWNQLGIKNPAKKLKIIEDNSDWKSEKEYGSDSVACQSLKSKFTPQNIEGSKWGKYLSKVDNSNDSGDENVSDNNEYNSNERESMFLQGSQENHSYSDNEGAVSCASHQVKQISCDLLDTGDIADEELDELLNL